MSKVQLHSIFCRPFDEEHVRSGVRTCITAVGKGGWLRTRAACRLNHPRRGLRRGFAGGSGGGGGRGGGGGGGGGDDERAAAGDDCSPDGEKTGEWRCAARRKIVRGVCVSGALLTYGEDGEEEEEDDDDDDDVDDDDGDDDALVSL